MDRRNPWPTRTNELQPSSQSLCIGKGQFSATIYITFGLSHQTLHLLVFLTELLAFELVFHFVARRSDLFPGSEDSFQNRLILLLRGPNESVSGFPRGRERSWL